MIKAQPQDLKQFNVVNVMETFTRQFTSLQFTDQLQNRFRLGIQ